MNRRLALWTQKQVSTHFRWRIQLVIAAMMLVTLSCSGEQAEPPPARLVPVRTIETQLRSMRESVPMIGTVHSVQEVTLLAQAPGTITSLSVNEGDWIERGATLLILDAPELAARLARGRAERGRAVADRELACRNAERDESLAKIGARSSLQWETSQKNCKAAGQAVAAAEASVRELQILQGKQVEAAPFAGRVIARPVEVGEYVAPGRPLLTLGGDELELRVNVTEADLGRGIQAGMRVSIRSPDGSDLSSQVRRVGPFAKGPGRIVEVLVPLPSAPLFRHGASVDLEFVLDEEPDAPSIPLDALREEGGQPAVFVIEGSVARLVPIEVGIRSGGWAGVRQGLDVGQRVAISNLAQLRDGVEVFAVAAEEVER